MTVQEFYDWALKNNCWDYEIKLEHGSMSGWEWSDNITEENIEISEKEETIILGF